MSAITPSSDLYLLHCPLEADMNHQMNFASASVQHEYFQGLSTNYHYDDFTYVRKEGYIKVPECMDDIITCNYLMYRNDAFGDKWFYAFITRMEFLSPECTAVYFATDVWQTWQFDITIKKCYVEREHVNDDTVGNHTIDEGIGTGEFIINSVTNKAICEPTDTGGFIALAVTELPTYTGGETIRPSSIKSRMYNGIIQGCYLMIFEYNVNGIQSLSNVIDWYVTHLTIEPNAPIVSMFALPKSIYSSSSMIAISYDDPFDADIYWLSSTSTATDLGTTTITRNSTINGYTPKNKKLLCYPYNYLLVTNNAGTFNTYNYEDFSNGASVQFNYKGVVCEGSSVKAIPVSYKKNATTLSGYAFGTDLATTPTFSWSSDQYLNWQAQNSMIGGVNTAQKFINSVMNTPAEGANAPAKDVFQYFGGIIQAGAEHLGATVDIIKNSLGMHKASITPDQVNGQSTGDLSFAIGRNGFTYYQMSVRAEVASVIDDFFSMYGYKVNALKVPNITGRTNWNYVKLHDANITGNIPQPDMQAIKNMMQKGVTFWHKPNYFLDYTQTNNIV